MGAFNAPESSGQAWVDATHIAGPEQAPWKLLLLGRWMESRPAVGSCTAEQVWPGW